MNDGVRKITMSIPVDLVDELDFVCEKLGLSRSALVSGLLVPVVPDYVAVCSRMSSYHELARRFRHSTRDDIVTALGDLLDDLKEEQYDLFEK